MIKSTRRFILWTGLAGALVLVAFLGYAIYVLRFEADYGVILRAAEKVLEPAETGGSAR